MSNIFVKVLSLLKHGKDNITKSSGGAVVVMTLW